MLSFPRLPISLLVEVGLMSGKTVALEASLHETVAFLRWRAATALGVGMGRLSDSSGSVLDVSMSITHTNAQDGESLLLQIKRAKVQASLRRIRRVLG